MDEQSIFAAALELDDPTARAAYLESACGKESTLRERIERLLRLQSRAGFLDLSPAVAAAPSDLELPTEGEGTLIGRYKLREQIGEGGMGVVFMAEQQQPVHREVALKIIKPGMDTRQVIARFQAERQALALMDHPNIARVLDAGATESGRPYFVMELVRGIPITEYCDKAKVPIRQRLELFITVCRAVQHAHQKGIIHRDLKPSNVLVTLHDGVPVPKVIDFGVAKATSQPLTQGSLYTGFAQLIGTPAYMSPEQAEMSGLDVDTRSDVYSLGVLLYELLTGSTPFDREILHKSGLDEFRRMVREVEPPLPSSRISTLHGDAISTVATCRASEPRKLGIVVRGELDWLVMKALEKDRNRRYETPGAFAADIERYLTNEPVQACPPSAAYRLRKFLRRNKGPVVAATVVLLTLVGGAVGTAIGLVRALDAEQLARRRLTDVEAANAQTTQALTDSEQARERADEQRAIARAVNEFFHNDLLGQAEIANQLGVVVPATIQPGDRAMAFDSVRRDPDVKVRTLLDRAAKTIDVKFADQPLTEAAIRLTIGNAYLALGQYDVAKTHLRRSVELHSAKLGFNHPDTLASKLCLERAHGNLADGNRIIQLLDEVFEGLAACQTSDDSFVLRLKLDLAGQCVAYGGGEASALNLSFKRAEALYKYVLQAQIAKLGDDHPDALDTRNRLATVYTRQHKYEQAESVLRDVLDLTQRKLGLKHASVADAQDALGDLLWTQKKFTEAETLFRQCLAIREETRPSDPSTFTTKSVLGGRLLELKRYAEAERLLVAGYNDPGDRGAFERLVALYDTLGKPEETAKWRTVRNDALRRRKEAEYETQKTKLGPQHPYTLVTKYRLAMCYQNQGRYDLAEPLVKELIHPNPRLLGRWIFYLDGCPRSFGTYVFRDDATVSRIDNHCTTHLITSGDGYLIDFGDWKIERLTLGTDPSTLTVEHFSPDSLLAGGEKPLLGRGVILSKAAEVLRTIYDDEVATLGFDDADALWTKGYLAWVYQQQGKYDQADKLYKEAVELQAAKWGAANYFTMKTKDHWASLYDAQEKYDQAEHLHKHVRSRFSVPEFTANVASHYEHWGKYSEAEPLWRELSDVYRWTRSWGPAHPARQDELAKLGLNLLMQRKFAEAERVIGESLAVREKTQPGHWTTFSIKSMLGRSLLGQKKYAEAEPLLLQGYEGLKQREARLPTQGKARLTEALERVVELYNAWGKPEVTAKWRKELDSRRAAQKEAASQQEDKEQEPKDGKTRDAKKEAKQPEAKN